MCNGTLPSRYHSLLPISAPPSRPEHSTLTPSAPALRAPVTALFIALLNATLFSNWSATALANNWASSSGSLTSIIFSFTGWLDNPSSPFLNLSASAPFLPITTPGLAV